MAQDPARLNLAECVTFIQRDPGWLRKLLLGSLVSLLSTIVIGIPLLLGYGVRVARRAAASEAIALPEWDDWGGLFIDGLRTAAALLVHYVAAGAVLVPLWLCVLLLGPMVAAATGGDWGAVIVVASMVALYGLTLLTLLALGLYLMIPLCRMAVLDRFSVVFEVAENWALLRRNIKNVLLALAAMVIANALSQFGVLACCIGILPASFWALTVLWYAEGALARCDPALREASAQSA